VKDFEALLTAHYAVLERFIRFRIGAQADADDILQEACVTAYQKFHQLKTETAFKPWLLSIARNKCNDYFRRKAEVLEIPLESAAEVEFSQSRMGLTTVTAVRETVAQLAEKDKQILYLYFWKELLQADIAKTLDIPLGTVKSRLYTAKKHFKEHYPYPPKGEDTMTKLPKIMPEYTIERTNKDPFPVRWEEMQGWLIVPRVGEKLTWGLYDFPARRRNEYTEIEVTGKAEVHDIEGVEIVAVQYETRDYFRTGALNRMERRFVAQLTDTHSRYLAESHVENGVRKLYTFLDGEDFLNNWGFGEDNCGNDIYPVPKGLLTRDGRVITGHTPKEVVDVVGRYDVTIGGKTYDTICIMDIQCFNDGVASEQYVDENGRTVLWRRFNKNDWAMDRFGNQLWSEKLPDNEQLIINGEIYVHWYDCISDYVL